MKRTRAVGNRALAGCRRVLSTAGHDGICSLSYAPRLSSPYRDHTSLPRVTERPSVPDTLGRPNKRAEMHAHNQVGSATGGPGTVTSSQIQHPGLAEGSGG